MHRTRAWPTSTLWHPCSTNWCVAHRANACGLTSRDDMIGRHPYRTRTHTHTHHMSRLRPSVHLVNIPQQTLRLYILPIPEEIHQPCVAHLQAPLPVYNTLGNHDLSVPREHYVGRMKLPSNYYAVTPAPGWRLLVLDTTDLSSGSNHPQVCCLAARWHWTCSITYPNPRDCTGQGSDECPGQHGMASTT